MKLSKRFILTAGIGAFLASLSGPYHSTRDLALGSSGAYRQRFSLGGLPPAWKGKVQARINRGGR